jgi:hypothetical protein
MARAGGPTSSGHVLRLTSGRIRGSTGSTSDGTGSSTVGPLGYRPLVTERIVAHVDEAGASLGSGLQLYVLAAVISAPCDHARVVDAMTALQIRKLPLHFHPEGPERRVVIAHALAGLPFHGAIVLTTRSTNTGQERARARLMSALLPRLEHVERVSQVIVESRAGGDRHDRRLRERLRRSRLISGALVLDHAAKSEPMLWPADFVASSYVAAHHHDERAPWDVFNQSHPIDVIEIPQT